MFAAEVLNKKSEISTPKQHGDQTKKRFPPSTGITFLVFATPLTRKRQFCNARLTRASGKLSYMNQRKWQYFIRGVTKVAELNKTSWPHKRNPIEINEKAIGGSKMFDQTREDIKEHNINQSTTKVSHKTKIFQFSFSFLLQDSHRDTDIQSCCFELLSLSLWHLPQLLVQRNQLWSVL